MSKIKFIHGADLHLDSPMVGLRQLPKVIVKEMQESTFKALEKLVNKAIVECVDFVILAGDLFDAENRSIKAQSRLRREMIRLQAARIPVLIVHGNHDHLGGDFSHLELPDNVYVFPEDVSLKKLVTRTGVAVHLYGFSYSTRHMSERKISTYVKQLGADYDIGILHGNLEGSTDHGNYAPFTLKELQDKQFDYWALGHIHKRQILSHQPPVVYPGNTQGRNKKETGTKGAYLVELDGIHAQIEFFPTSVTEWKEVTVDGQEVTSFDQLYHQLTSILEEERGEGINKLISLKIDRLSKECSISNMALNDLLETLQEQESMEQPFVWPYLLSVSAEISWDREQLAGEADFYAELFKTIDQREWDLQAISSLYQHPSAKKLLNEMTEEELPPVYEEAERLLMQLLLKV